MTEQERTRRGRVLMWVALAVLATLASAGVGWWLLSGEPEPEVAATTTSTTTTTSEAPPEGPVAPLTGARVAPEDAALLDRPALVVKLDNHPDAFPQWNVEQADVVLELLVEGISRLMVAFHSQDVASTGPVRSARTSDADLTAAFGRPLFAWSGANPTTTAIIRGLPWVDNVDSASLPSAYSRSRERRAPHNLSLDARAAFAAADEPVTAPRALFEYLAPGALAPGVEVAGVRVDVGASRSTFVWDDAAQGWRRRLGARLHRREDGEPLTVTNLVVLLTEYERSPADPISPEAVSVGSGRAWVFTAASMIEGTWQRPDPASGWTLRRDDGAAIALTPGTTWVSLARSGPELVAPELAQQLFEG